MKTNNNYNYKRLENKYLKIICHLFETDPKLETIAQDINIIDTYMTNDYHILYIYYQTIKDNEHIEKRVNLMVPYIKKQLSQKIHTRKIPIIFFKYDNSSEIGSRIDSILSKIKK